MRLLLATASIASLAASMLLGARVDEIRPRGPRGHVLYIPSSSYLAHVSLGFQSLVADSLYLWGIQYAADRKIKGQERYLPRLFDVVTDLDPRFDDAYYTGAFLIATDARRVDEAAKLLEKGFRIRKSFLFPYDAGFYCLMYSKDVECARKYFSMAADAPDCPLYVRRIVLKMRAIQDPRDAYTAYLNELRSIVASHTREEIQADVQKMRHIALMTARVRELEVTLETEALEELRTELGGAQSIAELRTKSAAQGRAPRPLERGNDPWRDPYGNVYEMMDGRIESPAGIRARLAVP